MDRDFGRRQVAEFDRGNRQIHLRRNESFDRNHALNASLLELRRDLALFTGIERSQRKQVSFFVQAALSSGHNPRHGSAPEIVCYRRYHARSLGSKERAHKFGR